MMYTFRFIYTDGTYDDYQRIKKVEYHDAISAKSVTEENFLQYNFPLGYNMYLFSENAKYTVSGKDLKSISVIKEE